MTESIYKIENKSNDTCILVQAKNEIEAIKKACDKNDNINFNCKSDEWLVNNKVYNVEPIN